jgi:hypothetical protein
MEAFLGWCGCLHARGVCVSERGNILTERRSIDRALAFRRRRRVGRARRRSSAIENAALQPLRVPHTHAQTHPHILSPTAYDRVSRPLPFPPRCFPPQQKREEEDHHPQSSPSTSFSRTPTRASSVACLSSAASSDASPATTASAGSLSQKPWGSRPSQGPTQGRGRAGGTPPSPPPTPRRPPRSSICTGSLRAILCRPSRCVIGARRPRCAA